MKSKNKIQHDWNSVTLALFKKYPNPFSSHVLTSDVLERKIDSLGRLITTRIFTKKGRMPKWGLALFNIQQAYVLETSIVDLERQEMTITTRNLSHSKLLLVEEMNLITKCQQESLVTQRVRFVSNTGFIPIRSRIENWAKDRFERGMGDSFKGLLYVINNGLKA